MGARGRDCSGEQIRVFKTRQRKRHKVIDCSICGRETSFPHGEHDERHRLRVCKSCYDKLKA